MAESGPAVRVQASTEPSFFPVVVSLFPFFYLLVCFPFIPTAGALSELHEVCDKHISELLGMIRCNKNNKIFT